MAPSLRSPPLHTPSTGRPSSTTLSPGRLTVHCFTISPRPAVSDTPSFPWLAGLTCCPSPPWPYFTDPRAPIHRFHHKTNPEPPSTRQLRPFASTPPCPIPSLASPAAPRPQRACTPPRHPHSPVRRRPATAGVTPTSDAINGGSTCCDPVSDTRSPHAINGDHGSPPRRRSPPPPLAPSSPTRCLDTQNPTRVPSSAGARPFRISTSSSSSSSPPRPAPTLPAAAASSHPPRAPTARIQNPMREGKRRIVFVCFGLGYE